MIKKAQVFIKKCLIAVLLIFSAGCSFLRNQTNLHVSQLASMNDVLPVVVIGGGVGGLTSALYFAQANIPCVVFQGSKPGGALSQSHSVRNWPGVKDAPGQVIVGTIVDQIKSHGVQLLTEKVVSVDFSVWPRLIRTQSLVDETVTKSYRALSVVIATGTEPNYLGVPGERDYWGKGVSNCAVCEGSLYQDKRVVIVGGGDAAVTEADYLADIAAEVFILVRKDSFRAKDIAARDKVLARPHVKVFYNTVIESIEGDDESVTHINTLDTAANARGRIECDGLFLAIGSQPNTKLFQNYLNLDARGFISRVQGQETSIPGIYAVGDATDYEFVQAITAAGDGCKAALASIKFLKDIGYAAPQQESLTPQDDELTPDDSTDAEVEDDADDDTLLIKDIKTEAHFKKYVEESKLPVVIDFYSTWCIPCQTMAPIVENLAEQLKGKVDFVSCNIAHKLVREIGVDNLMAKIKGQSIDTVPTFVFVMNGKQKARVVGVMSKQQFMQTIQKTFGLK